MNRKHMFVMATVATVVFAMTVPAMAQTPAPVSPTAQPTATLVPSTASTSLFVTGQYTVNVRSGPGREYTVIGQSRPVDSFDVTGRLADGTWLRLNFKGQEGWVSAVLFDVTGDLTTAPEAVAGTSAVLRTTTSATVSSATSGEVYGTTTGSVNLRSIPSVKGDVLVIVPFSVQLTATGRTSSNNWVQVSYNNQTGWITSAVYSVLRGKVTNLPVFDEAGQLVVATAEPTLMPTLQPTASS